jgi:hypothetical protein
LVLTGLSWWTIMLWVILLLGASGLIGGYAAERAIVPELQYHPGTPNEVVEICRQAAIAAARTHASEMGAQVIRVDAAAPAPCGSRAAVSEHQWRLESSTRVPAAAKPARALSSVAWTGAGWRLSRILQPQHARQFLCSGGRHWLTRCRLRLSDG